MNIHKTEIIPAIDILGGKCVRLVQGDYSRKTVYDENPVEVARRFEDAGIRRLHLVDLDGARARHVVNHEVLASISSVTALVIDFGGGISSDDDLRIAIENGAAMVTGGSVAVKSPSTFLRWLKEFGPDTIILGADANKGKIAVSGWEESTEIPILDFIGNFTGEGIQKVIATDISRDGMMAGPSFTMYREILERFPWLHLIASGGISSISDIEQLNELGLSGAITGKAIYEGLITLKEIGEYNLLLI